MEIRIMVEHDTLDERKKRYCVERFVQHAADEDALLARQQCDQPAAGMRPN
jgi:hypothetical protein